MLISIKINRSCVDPTTALHSVSSFTPLSPKFIRQPVLYTAFTNLVVEECIARGASYELCWRIRTLCGRVLPLQVLLQVELDDVLGAAQMAVVHGLRLVGIVDLDLLAGRRRRHRLEQRADARMRRLHVV